MIMMSTAPTDNKTTEGRMKCVSHQEGTLWTSYQIRKITGCACAGNAGNVFSRRRFQRKPLVGDHGMHHGTCVTHVPWCMSRSLTCGDGENVPGIPGACAPAILRIWQEAHWTFCWDLLSLKLTILRLLHTGGVLRTSEHITRLKHVIRFHIMRLMSVLLIVESSYNSAFIYDVPFLLSVIRYDRSVNPLSDFLCFNYF